MASAQSMKMVNGRVSEISARQASRVLKGEGLTISAFIRNSIEYIARKGSVPECGFSTVKEDANLDTLRSFVKSIEATPMPGKKHYGKLSEDELVERIRMERYGY